MAFHSDCPTTRVMPFTAQKKDSGFPVFPIAEILTCCLEFLFSAIGNSKQQVRISAHKIYSVKLGCRRKNKSR